MMFSAVLGLIAWAFSYIIVHLPDRGVSYRPIRSVNPMRHRSGRHLHRADPVR
jgi:hypothetical protein